MPYTTEKSMIFQVVETWANGSREVALRAMWDLLDDKRITEIDAIRSTSLNNPKYPDTTSRQNHVETDWWGRTRSNSGRWVNQPPYDIANPKYTGFWQHWHGDAEAVFRETMIRALAISLGLPRERPEVTLQYKGTARPRDMRGGSQHWPISILWKCPCPWYEGWIEFKNFGKRWWESANRGHVTVVLSTPSHGVKLYDTPIRPLTSDRVVNDPWHAYEKNPVAPVGPEGLWVVSQSLHTLVPNPTPPSPIPGDWGPPTLGQPVVSTGPVVCVSTSVLDGGAAPPGIPYTP
jgi:hypothetical protein